MIPNHVTELFYANIDTTDDLIQKNSRHTRENCYYSPHISTGVSRFSFFMLQAFQSLLTKNVKKAHTFDLLYLDTLRRILNHDKLAQMPCFFAPKQGKNIWHGFCVNITQRFMFNP